MGHVAPPVDCGARKPEQWVSSPGQSSPLRRASLAQGRLSRQERGKGRALLRSLDSKKICQPPMTKTSVTEDQNDKVLR